MEIRIVIDYTGKRIIHNNTNHPVYEVNALGKNQACLTIDDVISRVKNIIETNCKDLLNK